MAIADSGHIEPRLSHLVDIRASQMNGCAFCLDMHVKEAKLHGERELRLHHVAIWRESPLFTPKERAALAWTEALTRIAPTGISDELYDRAARAVQREGALDADLPRDGHQRLEPRQRGLPHDARRHDKAFGLDKAGLA